MRILSERTHTLVPHFLLSYTHNGSGFCFDCDKDGKVDESKLRPAALETYKEIQATGNITQWEIMRQRPIVENGVELRDEYNSYEYENVPGPRRMYVHKVEGVIQDYSSYHTTPAVGECNHCLRRVTLDSFTNTCECGTDYNMSGQELADRSQWGEETGEHLCDILGATRAAMPWDEG